jgi:hypothetical protein
MNQTTTNEEHAQKLIHKFDKLMQRENRPVAAVIMALAELLKAVIDHLPREDQQPVRNWVVLKVRPETLLDKPEMTKAESTQ